MAMKLPFGRPSIYRDPRVPKGNWNLEWRVWRRWFIEAELVKIGFGSDLVQEHLAAEAEEFLKDEE